MSDPSTQVPLTPPASVSPTVEKSNVGPTGIGGWLILPILGLVLTPQLVLFTFFSDFSELFKPGIWAALTTPGSRAYHPLFLPLVVFETVGNIVLIAIACTAIWKLKDTRRSFPKLMIGLFLFNAVFMILDAVLAGHYTDAMGLPPDRDAFKSVGRAIVAVVVWVPYFLISKRVKNTFVN